MICAADEGSLLSEGCTVMAANKVPSSSGYPLSWTCQMVQYAREL